MLGILWFFLWQSAGIAVSYYLFPEKRIAVRLWLGSVIGTLLSMWAPIPFAFLRGFGITAHIAAAIRAARIKRMNFKRSAPFVYPVLGLYNAAEYTDMPLNRLGTERYGSGPAQPANPAL